ncbi:CU044_5270 family protein [Micromonospora chalcea]|uniref:CU044_5270 family protein n=1 Tax=Micromonospora chalcea TaxID=1874 RepID=UPI0009FF702D|nr:MULTISPECIES: CU044_5270 family protein [Micromonospora]MCT2278081.1 CU044_5270 family protein [Micromonospora chalcea]
MKDLDLVKQLGEDLGPREGEPLAALPATAFRDMPHRRPFKAWRTGVVAVAALGAASFVASLWLGPHSLTGSGVTTRAATVLDNAAAVSQQTTVSPPQGGAYIFTETISSFPAQVQQPDGSFKIVRDAPTVTQIWLPVNPTKGGQQRQRPKSGNAEWGPWVALPPCKQQELAKIGNSVTQCTLGVLPAGFPASPSAVLALLKGDSATGAPSPQPSSGGPASGQDALAFERASDLLMQGTYLLPDQRSAIFKALAQLNGVEAVRDVQDGAGRSGIGISAGGSEALVFDSTSFMFLGTTSSAVVRQSVTTEAGKVP